MKTSLFERRHYNFLAYFFAHCYSLPEKYRAAIVKELAEELKKDNGNFKPDRFFKWSCVAEK